MVRPPVSTRSRSRAADSLRRSYTLDGSYISRGNLGERPLGRRREVLGQLARRMRSRGLCAGIGWLGCADFDRTQRGVRGHCHATISDGVTGVTHLFNAMPPLSARDPRIIGAALAEPRLTAGLIVDGVHVDPVSVRAAFAAKGSDGIALVTDAMPTVGTSLDRFELVGRTIKLAGGRLTTEEGTLAGAHLDMASAVRNAVRLAQLPLEDALRADSLTPARFLGLDKERGALVPGARADLVALTQELEVIATWLDGSTDDVKSGRSKSIECETISVMPALVSGIHVVGYLEERRGWPGQARL